MPRPRPYSCTPAPVCTLLPLPLLLPQALNFLGGMLLLLTGMREEEAFWLLLALVEQSVPDFYSKHMTGIRIEQNLFSEFTKAPLPKLAAHLHTVTGSIAYGHRLHCLRSQAALHTATGVAAQASRSLRGCRAPTLHRHHELVHAPRLAESAVLAVQQLTPT